ncbi:MAG: SGNH/GDSL hydrolase family protein [Chloroflexi bacterium]|nr:SGNH/GDSL hydrolase family protein [Chloroflexota bacterium]
MKFLARVILKGIFLFLLVNLFFAVGSPDLGKISAYNHLFPSRPRLPFGENPREAYNFSLFNLDAMFESHEISAGKPAREFRVVLIGDSSVWGTLLQPDETLAGQLNAMGLSAPDGRNLRFYNLGYPTLSLTKDLMVLDRALAYQPDLVIWLATLESFPLDKQLNVPLVENNLSEARSVITKYGLALETPPDQQTGLWARSLVGQRKNVADILRLQLYGAMWAATGIDQIYPEDYPPAQVDLEADPTFHGEAELRREALLMEVFERAQAQMGAVPLLVVNEPILVSTGENSDIRYNYYYPREAYDQYRRWLGEQAAMDGFAYLDAWDIVPQDSFTNSAIHINREGTALLAAEIRDEVLRLVE